MQGILFLALGEGSSDWDGGTTIPSKKTTVKLVKEILRMAISPDEITYLDNTNQSSSTPTDQLQITVEFEGARLVEKHITVLREFGLFGGNASDKPDSGYMINYVIHPRINISPDMTLIRELRLRFGAPLAMQRALEVTNRSGAVSTGLSALPVIALQGVGEAYAKALNNKGIKTIGDLSGTKGPLQSLQTTRMPYTELKAKARLAIRYASELPNIPKLMDKKISDLLSSPIDELMLEADMPREVIEQLQDNLTALRLVTDDRYLNQLRLSDLMS
jgi:hypothetical protein